MLLAGATAAEPDSFATGSIRSGKFNLEYRIEGQGPTAVVIGFPTYYARVFSQNLRRELRLVFVDHRGSARSPGPVDNSEFELEKLIDDVELVRSSLELDPVIVIGHSGHSFLALKYAKKYPESVSHVVLICIAPDLSDRSSELALKRWDKQASAARKAALADNYQRMSQRQLAEMTPRDRFVQDYLREGPRMWFDPEFDASPLWEGVFVNAQMMAYVWGEVFRDIDITRGLESFERPVLVALGRYDFSVAPVSSWRSIQAQFQDLTIKTFDRSAHTVPLEQPREFDRTLLNWIGSKR